MRCRYLLNETCRCLTQLAQGHPKILTDSSQRSDNLRPSTSDSQRGRYAGLRAQCPGLTTLESCTPDVYARWTGMEPPSVFQPCDVQNTTPPNESVPADACIETKETSVVK